MDSASSSGTLHDGVHRVLPFQAEGGNLEEHNKLVDAAKAKKKICVRKVQYTEEEVSRGVFTLSKLQRGTLVEVAHCIHVPKGEYEEHVKHTVFEHYVFNCKKRGGSLLCLGLGSLFNHSESPNLDYRIDEDNLIIRFYAARDIEAETELSIFYGNVWFNDPTSKNTTSSVSSSPPENEDNLFSKLCI